MQGLAVDQAAGNMEGKEVRYRRRQLGAWATSTTDASNGAVNSMHDSFNPIGGLVPLLNIQLGELIFGGVGAGLYAMLVFVLVSVFIAGLMVGRTPEYLGKKIESREVKLAMLYVLIFPLIILYFSGWSAVAPYGLSSLEQRRPARAERDPLCLQQCGGQQWLGLCRTQRQHSLVQREPGPDDADGPLFDDRARPGDCRFVWWAKRLCRRVWAHSRQTGRCSLCCWSAWLLSSGR